MSRQTIKRTAKVCFDIFLFLLVCLAEFALHKWWQPLRRGFFCGDESLMYPYRENTISITALAIVCLCVPTLVILAVELFKQLDPCIGSKRKSMSNNAAIVANGAAATTTTSTTSSAGGCRIGYRLLQCYKHIGYFLFGLGLTLLATDMAKFAVGRLRPNFFAICQPQLADGTTCDDDVNQGHYITDYTCLAENFTVFTVRQATLSFPSGHASKIFYAMLYLSIYLQVALGTRASKLLKHLLQFVFMMFAAWVSLTRVSDHWHHWSDVLTGVVLGSIMAIVVTIFMTDLFEKHHRRFLGNFKTNLQQQHHHHQQQQYHLQRMTGNSSNSSTAKSANAAAAAAATLPAYTFGTLPYLHYPPQHAHQYSHATYQNYGYVP